MIQSLSKRGDWVRVLPSIFATGTHDPPWKQQILAVCLAAGEGVAASHRTADALWKLEGVVRAGLEVSTQRRLKLPAPRLVIHQTRRPFTVHFVEGIPTTSVDRTLVDLSAHLSVDVLEIALEDALRRRLTTQERLAAATEAHGGRGRPGGGVLRELLAARGETVRPAESGYETRVIQALRRARLPRPIRQHQVRCPDGRMRRIDLAYPQAKLGIEVDGFRWHSGRKAFDEDRRRINTLIAAGWTILHATKQDIDEGCARLVATVRTILARLAAELPFERGDG